MMEPRSAERDRRAADVYGTARGPLARGGSPVAAPAPGRRGAAIPTANVRPVVLRERDRARGARAPREVRSRGPQGRPGVVCADAGVLVPDRAAFAAPRRALAPAAPAPSVLAPRRGGRVGGDLAPAARRARAAVRPGAAGALRAAR